MSLDELASSSSYYLFELFSEMENKVVKTFVSSELATAAERTRFNKFTFTEVGVGGSEDFYAGQIRLPYNGSYLLKVYSQSSSGNIDPLAATLIYQEQMQVFGNPDGTTWTEYTGADDDDLPYNFEGI